MMKLLSSAAILSATMSVEARLGEQQHRQLAASTMLITEIMYDPSACSDSIGEWIELFNNGNANVDLTGWTVSDSSGASKSLNADTIGPGQYYLVARTTDGCNNPSLNADVTFGFSLNNGGDTVKLSDSSGNVVDEHTFSSGDAASGKSTQRQADGSGSPTNTWEEGSAGGSPRSGYDSGAAGVKITEIMYNPSSCSDSQGEFVELYNAGTESVDLSTWSLGDNSGFASLSTTLAPGAYYIAARTTDGCGGLNAESTFSFSLSNSGDSVHLYDSNHAVIDSHTYTSNAAGAGKSIELQADGTWAEGPSGGTPRSGYSGGSPPSPGPPTPAAPAPTPSPSPAPAPAPTAPAPAGPPTTTKTYQSYELELVCGTASGYANRFTYELVGPDNGNYPRRSSFYYDNTLPQSCQQTSRSSYSHSNCGSSGRKTNPYCFDRGHLVMANHLDNDETDIYESNMMTNILPQAAGFNQAGGAWIHTEEIIECGRDISNVVKQVIFGGAMFSDPSNDYFLSSHGVPTPEEFWKVIVRYYTSGTPEVIAWVMPNHYTSTDDLLDTYLDSVANIQALTGDAMPELPASYSESAFATGTSWSKPSGCDLSRRS